MKTPCAVTIKGRHENISANDAIQSAFEEKIDEISFMARDEFDLAESDSDITRIKDFLDGINPENIISPETEFSTRGIYEYDEKAVKVSFADSIGNFSKNPVMTTFCVFKNGMLTMIKQEPKISCITFQSGKRIQYDYDEKFASPITIFSRNVYSDLSRYGGVIDLDYFIEVNGITLEHNSFNINIKA